MVPLLLGWTVCFFPGDGELVKNNGGCFFIKENMGPGFTFFMNNGEKEYWGKVRHRRKMLDT